MKKEQTGKLITYSLLALIPAACTQTNKSEEKPNIIYILADDLGYGEVGVYGQQKIETPNIDALAKDGIIFTQHYTGAPVSAPARSSLLTGLHMGHTPIRGNDEWSQRGNVWDYRAMIQDSTLEGQRPLPEGVITLPELLKKAGYRTGMVGKWGLGAPHTNSIPTKKGFDYFFGYNYQRQAHTYTPVHLYENEKRYHLKNDTIAPRTGLTKDVDPMSTDSYAKYTGQYAPEVSFEKMMGFIEQNKDDAFFLYWASPIPHVPLQAPENWIEYYKQKFGEENPYYFYEGERGSYFPTRNPRATYAAMVSYLDENIGKLVQYLKDEGLYENTLIIFTSDNGPTYTGGADSEWFDSGGPFRSEYGRGKGFVYEGGIRVPMIASWPDKIKAGSKTEHISAFWDVLPTLCEVAQTETPEDSDGISYYNTLTGDKPQENHEYLYWEYPEYSGQLAIRMGKWKIVWKNIKKGNKEIELYDLSNDLSEEFNLAAKHPEIIEKVYKIIKTEHRTPENERFIIEAIEEICKE